MKTTLDVRREYFDTEIGRYNTVEHVTKRTLHVTFEMEINISDVNSTEQTELKSLISGEFDSIAKKYNGN